MGFNCTGRVPGRAIVHNWADRALNNCRECHCILVIVDLCNDYEFSGRWQSDVLRKGHLFLMCTKVPYGVAGMLELNPGKSQEQNLREPPILIREGGGGGASRGDT